MKKALLLGISLICLMIINEADAFYVTQHTLILYEHDKRVTDDAFYAEGHLCPGGACQVSAGAFEVTIIKVGDTHTPREWQSLLSEAAFKAGKCQEYYGSTTEKNCEQTPIVDSQYAAYLKKFRETTLAKDMVYQKTIKLPLPQNSNNEKERSALKPVLPRSMIGYRSHFYVPKLIKVDLPKGNIKVIDRNLLSQSPTEQLQALPDRIVLTFLQGDPEFTAFGNYGISIETDPETHIGHLLVPYRVSGGAIYVYDPNEPYDPNKSEKFIYISYNGDPDIPNNWKWEYPLWQDGDYVLKEGSLTTSPIQLSEFGLAANATLPPPPPTPEPTPTPTPDP